ncbi:hypothetical protein ILYODFUR_021483 [Ilyodon furcidens]|uniref:Uncharacterized protein n=1 Tax=Ilyodon furcidens TaxID=33524 RepID=A0ABV0V6Y9_9TELE
MFVHTACCCYSYVEYPVGVTVVRGVSGYIQFFCTGCCVYAGFPILDNNKCLTRNHNGLVIISKSTVLNAAFFPGFTCDLQNVVKIFFLSHQGREKAHPGPHPHLPPCLQWYLS